MRIGNALVLVLVLAITFLPPAGAAAVFALRWGKSSAGTTRRAGVALFRDVRFVCATALGIIGTVALPRLAGLELFTVWALMHGSFIFIWPLLFVLISGIYCLLRL
jgi:hypothetical protein